MVTVVTTCRGDNVDIKYTTTTTTTTTDWSEMSGGVNIEIIVHDH